MFWARSGWVYSIPVSTSPITIEGLPVVICHAASAESSAPTVPFANGPSVSPGTCCVGIACPVFSSPHCCEKPGSFGGSPAYAGPLAASASAATAATTATASLPE